MWQWAIECIWSVPEATLENFIRIFQCQSRKRIYQGVSKSFRTGHLERELQMVQLPATRFSCIAILWVSLVSFDVITLFVASQRVIPNVSVYFVIDSVRKLLDTTSYKSLSFSVGTRGARIKLMLTSRSLPRSQRLTGWYCIAQMHHHPLIWITSFFNTPHGK
jgi:hypothetical protein